MIKDTWNKCYSSVCSISFFNVSGDKISSGTGFKVGTFLITNNHVYFAPIADTVELRFMERDGSTMKATKTISYAEFKNRLLSGDSENNWDYAILDLKDNEFNLIPSLKLRPICNYEIGDPIAIFGFQFDQPNLSLKQGIISSRFTRNNVKYIQIDSSVNNGNSGGPLINVETNEVIGIVTRKHTGLTDAFDELTKSLDNNIAVLNQANSLGSALMMGINTIETLKISQEQLKLASREIKRSANVGIGFAYELEKVLEYLNNL